MEKNDVMIWNLENTLSRRASTISKVYIYEIGNDEYFYDYKAKPPKRLTGFFVYVEGNGDTSNMGNFESKELVQDFIKKVSDIIPIVKMAVNKKITVNNNVECDNEKGDYPIIWP